MCSNPLQVLNYCTFLCSPGNFFSDTAHGDFGSKLIAVQDPAAATAILHNLCENRIFCLRFRTRSGIQGWRYGRVKIPARIPHPWLSSWAPVAPRSCRHPRSRMPPRFSPAGRPHQHRGLQVPLARCLAPPRAPPPTPAHPADPVSPASIRNSTSPRAPQFFDI